MKSLVCYLSAACLLLQVSSFAQSVVSAVPVVYQLPAGKYDSVKTILKKSWEAVLKDTIILEYQPALPAGAAAANDEIIQQNVTEELRFLHNQMVGRRNTTVLQYAAEAPDNGKLLEYDNLVNIDKGNLLQALLFNHQTAAGSVMLLPSGKCIYFSGTEKWKALTTPPQVIKHLINNDIAKK